MRFPTFFKSLTSTSTRRRPTRRRSPASRLYLEALEDRRLLTTFSVLNFLDSGPGSLREAITNANGAPGADLISFAPAARDGTIALTGGQLSITDDLTIDGPGAGRLAVSGNDASRVFQISSGVAVSIDDLTVTHGRAVGRGGGILNAGTLTLSRAILSDNLVVGLPGATPGAVVDAFGGGIFNTGALTVRSSSFVHNQCIGADGTSDSIGSSALGGAFMSAGTASAPATATVSSSTFVNNQVIGGAAGIGASRAGVGGAINNTAGTCTVRDSVFRDNQAVGGLDNGVPGGFGAGLGGAISNVSRFGDSTLSVSHCTLTNNRAIGGAADAGPTGQDGRGGAGIGGNGGNGQGGGVFNGGASPVGTPSLTLQRSLVVLNRADGGAAGSGGSAGLGQGAGLYLGLGGLASADAWTLIFANDASTSDDDVFGILI